MDQILLWIHHDETEFPKWMRKMCMRQKKWRRSAMSFLNDSKVKGLMPGLDKNPMDASCSSLFVSVAAWSHAKCPCRVDCHIFHLPALLISIHLLLCFDCGYGWNSLPQIWIWWQGHKCVSSQWKQLIEDNDMWAMLSRLVILLALS